MFTWVLQRLADAQLAQGWTLGIDATTLEANAALRSIVRRDTGEEYEAWLTRLAEASGLATPTRAELARFDRKRKKKGSNDDWTHPQDPDAKITKMKDGCTHLAHTAEHAVDLETGAVVGVTVQDADDGDTTTMVETLLTAVDQVDAALPAGAGLAQVVGDKRYHSNETMVAFAALGVRSYVSSRTAGDATGRARPRPSRRCMRIAVAFGARASAHGGQRAQRLVRQRPDRAERMVGRHPLFRRHVAEHVAGLLIVTEKDGEGGQIIDGLARSRPRRRHPPRHRPRRGNPLQCLSWRSHDR